MEKTDNLKFASLAHLCHKKVFIWPRRPVWSESLVQQLAKQSLSGLRISPGLNSEIYTPAVVVGWMAWRETPWDLYDQWETPQRLNKLGRLQVRQCCLRRGLEQACLSPQSKHFNQPLRFTRDSIDSCRLNAMSLWSDWLRRTDRIRPPLHVVELGNIAKQYRSISGNPVNTNCDGF